MKLLGKTIKFWQLPFDEKFILILTFFVLFIIRLGLWVLPFRFLQSVISKAVAFHVFSKQNESLVTEKIIRSVRRASKIVPAATCLTQALTALLLMKLNGQQVELKFGVAVDLNREFSAHAWLEKGGKIILGKVPQHRKYRTLEPGKYAVL